MGFLGLKPVELIIILVIVLLLFGPKNLPKLGGAIGKTFKNLKEGMDGGKKDDADSEQAEEEAETVEAVAEDDTQKDEA